MSDFRKDSEFYEADERPPVRFEARQWLLLGAGFALAVLAVWLFDWAGFGRWGRLPGFGMALMTWGLLAAGWAYAGKRRLRGWALWLTAFDVLLGACYAAYANRPMQYLNLIVLAATMPASLLLMGAQSRGACDAFLFVRSWGFALAGLFEHAWDPISALAALRKGGGKRLGGVLIGLAICVPAAAVVLSLLASADEVFLDILRDGLRSVEGLNAGNAAVRTLCVLALSLMIFSALSMLSSAQPGEPRAARPLALPPVSGGMLLVLLDAVYALFVYVQFRNLFGGAESAAMAGGYAQYARSGFYQLVLIALINMGALFGLRSQYPSSGFFRAMLAVLVGETGVILASAAWRMNLYVQAYGLSVLRVLTLWGMGIVALLLMLAAAKLFVPKIRVFPAMLALLCVLWLGLNVLNMDRVVAEYNAGRALRGEMDAGELDLAYLSELSPDALGALKKLERAGIDGADFAAAELLRRRPDNWTGMSLAWLMAGAEQN